MTKSPTGRVASKGPNIQTLTPKTKEGTAIREAFVNNPKMTRTTAAELAEREAAKKYLPENYTKPTKGLKCMEASPLSGKVYIPCGKPAEYVVVNRGETYAMCAACADHNVRHRGALYRTGKGPVEYTKIEPPSTNNKLAAAKKVIDSLPPAPNVPAFMQDAARKKELNAERDEVKRVAALPPVAPVTELKLLSDIHDAGRPVEQAFIKLNIAARKALGEIKGHGDRAAHLVAFYSRLRTAQDILAEQIKDFNTILSMVAETMLPEAFERESLQTLTTADGDRMTISQKLYASIVAAMKDQAFAWLRKHGHAAMITETVNSSSLSAFAKAELAEGRELPESIFSIHQKPSASLTRGKKK